APLCFFIKSQSHPRQLPSSPTRRSSDLEIYDIQAPPPQVVLSILLQQVPTAHTRMVGCKKGDARLPDGHIRHFDMLGIKSQVGRSEEHTSELQSREKLVCRLLLEKKKQK